MTDIHVAAVLPPGHTSADDCACRPIVTVVDRFHGTRYVIHRKLDASSEFGPIHQEASHARRNKASDPCQACAHSRNFHPHEAIPGANVAPSLGNCVAIAVNRAGFAGPCPCPGFADPAADPGEVPGPAPQHG